MRYSLYFLFWLLLSSPGRGRAQTATAGGARATALGGAVTALQQSASGRANPASWATLSGRAVLFSASEAFGLAALRLGALTYVEPTRRGTFTAGLLSFGYEAYRETHALVGYAHGFRLGGTRRFHLGLTLRYQHVAIPTYGHAGRLTLGVGGLALVRPSVHAGFQVVNLPMDGHKAIERALALGVAYTPAERAVVLLDVYKSVRFPLSVRTGVEVYPVAALALRAGAATEPTRFTVGAGIRLGKLVADVGGEHHDALGWSPGVSFGLRW